ncbi:unnamed protein product [Cyclocybe aegerita]|uniref:RRM domain-containing protein n=1 Tax=Cyclocybe aegerita TaxID=1973307 RepID=A0A8S0VS59_CYCAE|nr:unnamed protein product [Cyclocybe aegerita]
MILFMFSLILHEVLASPSSSVPGELLALVSPRHVADTRSRKIHNLEAATMSSTQKLTKKQKKGFAFRERKSGSKRQPQGPRGDDELDEMEANAVPAMEDQDLAVGDGDEAEGARAEREKAGKAGGNAQRDESKRKEGKVGGKGKGKAETENVRVSEPVLKKAGKRKREDGDEGEGGEDGEDDAGKKKSSQKPAKRKKGSEEDVGGAKKDINKQRFLLYTTPREAIEKHFSACDPPPTIRLLTPKAAPGATQKAKSKGCAFLEFTHRNALQQALKLHQSELDGRRINVELTAGGGGKSEVRLAKVRERNKALLGQRIERVEKEAEKDNSFPNLPQKPQRFSMTSGLEQKLSAKKTWTVGDVEDGETHRGGQKHRGKKKSKSKAWGTGVNAIPVG